MTQIRWVYGKWLFFSRTVVLYTFLYVDDMLKVTIESQFQWIQFSFRYVVQLELGQDFFWTTRYTHGRSRGSVFQFSVIQSLSLAERWSTNGLGPRSKHVLIFHRPSAESFGRLGVALRPTVKVDYRVLRFLTAKNSQFHTVQRTAITKAQLLCVTARIVLDCARFQRVMAFIFVVSPRIRLAGRVATSAFLDRTNVIVNVYKYSALAFCLSIHSCYRTA